MNHAPATIPPRRLFPPVGECIWCGKKPPEVVLTGEHVIPNSFGGIWILQEGCCKGCEKDQSAYIGKCCDLMFAALRLHHKLPVSKKTKRSQRTVRIVTENDAITELPHDKAPGIVALPYLDLPRLLGGKTATENELAVTGCYFASTTSDDADRTKMLHSDGYEGFSLRSDIPITEFTRVLAHIAHAFYMAQGFSSREHSLMLLLAKGNLTNASQYLGGWPDAITEYPPPPSEANIHQIIPFNARVNGKDYFAANIRLFTHLRPLPPIYTALLCERAIPKGDHYLLFEPQQLSEGYHLEITGKVA